MSSSPLVLQSLTKRYGQNFAVQDVSFNIKQSEIVGFLGPNGAGKTTTIRMALGLVTPDSGHVKLFGNAPSADTLGRVGFLPEERGLYRKSSARESIAHMARLNGMRKKEAFARADDMMDKYGLGDAKRKKVKDLSKGMAQKVQLIAAISHDPEFFILDEPFSGLDPVNQKILENMVREIAERGSTIMFSTHVMEHAQRLCNRIILMSGGQKIFDGSTQEALSRAPRRLRLETPAQDAPEWLGRFTDHLDIEGPGLYHLTLKDGSDSQDVLEHCVAQKARLIRFEPEKASLHDAFVAMVGSGNSEAPHENTEA